MAGKIIVSTLQSDTDNSISFVANTGATIFSANISHGIAGSFIANGSITGAKIALGSITGDDIATGQITGNLIATNAISQNNIVSVNASVATVGTLPTARLPTGTVLQVRSTTKTDSFTTTSTSFTDITGLSVSITPTSATSNVFVTVTFAISGSSSAALAVFNLVRNSTNISQPSTSPTFTATTGGYLTNFDNILPVSFTFLDSPATTSATTYKVQTRLNGGTMYFNRRETTDCAFTATITAMEIAG